MWSDRGGGKKAGIAAVLYVEVKVQTMVAGPPGVDYDELCNVCADGSQ